MNKKPIIGITMGDPAGIGPEVIIKAIQDKTVKNEIIPLLIGNRDVFRRAMDKYGSSLNMKEYTFETSEKKDNKFIQIIQSDTLKGIKYGKWSSDTGLASFKAVEKGVHLALDKKIDALVTAPICKAAWSKIGVEYTGHTELLAKMTKTKEYSMMFTGGVFKLILVTIHKPISKLSGLIKKRNVIQTGITGEKAMKEFFNIKNPRIAVAGLNPHAGEDGLLGKEEITEIIPAIKELAKRKNIKMSGPFPADTLFVDAQTGKYDLIMCMYHDQGLIPFKMMAFHKGVNITAGLPIVRTSPDHGTGFNIAGKGIANPGSMIAAILTASEIVQNRRKRKNK